MTVKLAKFFNSSTASAPPPLPPPNPTSAPHPYYGTKTKHYRQPQPQPQQQQQQQQQQHYNAYIDEEEDDDNMSLYSTTASSIMTARDHPFNNSQRPLLAERKPPPQLLLLNKKKHFNVPVITTTATLPAVPSVTTNQLQAQPQTQQQQQLQPQKSYLSPYVQQQKRDSAKGLHGFNDFDILSQQYNQHLQSPHIGYPYGSPPSPTANSSDFVFDALTQVSSATATVAATSTPRYGNISHFNGGSSNGNYAAVATTTTPTFHNDINEVDYYANATVMEHSCIMGKPSRFEDDFCCRRNADFTKPALAVPPPPPPPHKQHDEQTSTSSRGGPFIFGVSHEQQCDLLRMPPGGRGFRDSNDDAATVINGALPAADKYSCISAASHCGQATMQSTSDTSTSSRDCSGGSGGCVRSSSKGAKRFLLRKRKSKKNTKAAEKVTKTETSSNKSNKSSSSSSNKPTIKCVVVGDGAVGKTNLIRSYLENRFNTEHVPTASDIYNADVMVNDSPVHLTVCDTAGQDTLDPLRELCYPDSDVFLLCFSVARPETFHAIKTKWAPKFCKTKAALVLVGTQADLRTNANVLNKLQTNGEKPISYADAWDLAKSIGAKYIETSSATQDKVKEVFDTAIWEGLVPTTLPPTPPPLWKKLFCLA